MAQTTDEISMEKGYSYIEGNEYFRGLLQILKPDISGLMNEPYLPKIERLNIHEEAHEAKIDFSAFTGLKELTIQGFKEYVLPKEICGLRHLESLSVVKCTLPPEIGSMAQLHDLRIDVSDPSRIPESIVELQGLTSLDISSHEPDILSFPRWVSKLHGLESLDLSLCRFSDIDIDITRLPKLKRLSFIGALSYLNINGFPPLGNLKNLEKLRIDGDGYYPFETKSYPKADYDLFPSIIESIKDLQSLKTLELNGWRSRKKSDYLLQGGKKTIPDIFDHFPKLEILGLSGMRIELLPPSIYKLKHLRVIYLHDNAIDASALKFGSEVEVCM